jgi:hypothetical protein
LVQYRPRFVVAKLFNLLESTQMQKPPPMLSSDPPHLACANAIET